MPRADDDIVDMPRERAGLPKVLVVLGLIVVLFGALAVGGRSWYQRQVDPPGPPGAVVDVTVPNGARLTDLGSLLGDADVVANATIFRFWIRDKEIDLQAGIYQFRRSSSFAEVETVLRAGPRSPVTTDVTIPEGFTVEQVIARIHDEVPRFTLEQIRAALADAGIRSQYQPADQTSLEGTLFPSTYEVGPLDTPRSLVERMVDTLDAEAQRAGIAEGVRGDDVPPGLTPYQVLTVASLIERETGNPQESPKIARVIYNRLLAGEPLGIDATSRYLSEISGLPIDFESDSPYNTRRQAGLPPTPIAAPGRASIEAALTPATGDWFYYVLETEDQHFFTASEDEFLAAKQACEDADLGCG
ncbi:MAG TPA: endolytic transglycosylase MltG [Acidimicrobiales bacterium]|nr:endolytic transglycosylase MltG [Acidimicrobiales bacterium]